MGGLDEMGQLAGATHQRHRSAHLVVKQQPEPGSPYESDGGGLDDAEFGELAQAVGQPPHHLRFAFARGVDYFGDHCGGGGDTVAGVGSQRTRHHHRAVGRCSGVRSVPAGSRFPALSGRRSSGRVRWWSRRTFECLGQLYAARSQHFCSSSTDHDSPMAARRPHDVCLVGQENLKQQFGATGGR